MLDTLFKIKLFENDNWNQIDEIMRRIQLLIISAAKHWLLILIPNYDTSEIIINITKSK